MTAFEPVSNLFDREVHDARGEIVGRVSELLMDVGRGQIEYVLIALNQDRLRRPIQVTVPWSIIRVDTRGIEHWQLTVSKRSLEQLAEAVSGARLRPSAHSRD